MIYLVAKLKILAILHLVHFGHLKMIWVGTLFQSISRSIIDVSSCLELRPFDENCGLQHILNAEKMAIFEAIFLTSHRRKHILRVYH